MSKTSMQNKANTESFVWKLPRGSEGTQESMNMREMTQEQLQKCYNHCKSMLYSESKKNPGRYVVRALLTKQRDYCNAELLKRYEAFNYKVDNATEATEQGNIAAFQSRIRTILDQPDNQKDLPKTSWETTPIARIVSVPVEYCDVTISATLKALSGSLGMFDSSHITKKFIFEQLGVFPTKEEKEEYLAGVGNLPDKIKFNLNITPERNIKITPKGLTYLEFRSMLLLKNKKYTDLSQVQLVTLRDKVLYKLRDKVDYHIHFWEGKIKELTQVAKEKSFELVG